MKIRNRILFYLKLLLRILTSYFVLQSNTMSHNNSETDQKKINFFTEEKLSVISKKDLIDIIMSLQNIIKIKDRIIESRQSEVDKLCNIIEELRDSYIKIKRQYYK